MGRVAFVNKARKAETREKNKQRTQRSVTERSKRLAVETGERKIKKVVVQKEPPSKEDAQLLLSQIGQSCRIPFASRDLCTLIRSFSSSSRDEASGSSRKRGRQDENVSELDRIADSIIQLQKVAATETEEEVHSGSDDDVETLFVDAMKNQNGQRTFYTLLTALKEVGSMRFNALEDALIEEFEENVNLSKNHVACRLMSALSFHGSDTTKTRVLAVFQHQVKSEEDLMSLLRNNHTSTTIVNLLRHLHDETSEWLREILLLNEIQHSGSTLLDERIFALIEDPVASRVMRELIDKNTRAAFFQHVDINSMMNSKRGSSFLRDLFTFENDGMAEPQVASLLATVLERIGGDLGQLSMDKRANFVVQKVITLTTLHGSKASESFQTLLRLLTPNVSNLISSRVGVHVVCTLAETALHLSPQLQEVTASSIVNRSNVNDLLFCQTGSLAVRALMPIVKNSGSKTATLLKSAIEQNLDDLLFHSVGNLVAQKYFKEIGTGPSSAFARKVVKDQNFFLSMCKDNFASHVVFSLLESVDASTHTIISNSLKSHSKTLAVHVNGRFLVEKVIPASSELRNELVRQFIPLCLEKGTQHILCSLVAFLDQRGVDTVMEKLTANLQSICTQQCGSIAVQKLMQSNPAVKAAILSVLNHSESLRAELANNFFGKFVVHIAEN